METPTGPNLLTVLRTLIINLDKSTNPEGLLMCKVENAVVAHYDMPNRLDR